MACCSTEACGHGLEADLVAKGASVFAGRRGEQVASPLVTLVDDGTMAAEWGAITIDDEGHPAQRNTLIQDGVLTDYMWDFLRSRKEGRPQSGNGRRQSYQHLPMVRMTNTFVLNGAEDPHDIIKATDHGVYVALLGGGQVNTATGDFVFGMTEAYMIKEASWATRSVRATSSATVPEVLRDIDLLGNDFAMGMPGTCGKDGQGVPVGDGQPTLRVQALTVGGTADDDTTDGRPGPPREAPATRRTLPRRTAGPTRETIMTTWESELLPYRRAGGRAGRAGRAGRGLRRAVLRHERAGLRGRDRATPVGPERGHRHPGHSRRSGRVRLRRRARRGVGRRGAGRSARQRHVRHARRVGRARPPDGVPVADLDLWSDDLAGYGTDDKVASPSSSNA